MEIFSNLTYDIQQKIYNEVLIIQNTEKNKRYFSGYVLGELKYHGNKNKDRLNKIYEIFDLGFIGELCERPELGEGFSYWKNVGSYNTRYYNELDYLMNCFITQTIEDNEITYSYEIKPNRIQKYNYIDFEDDMENNMDFEEDNYDFKKYKKYEICQDYIPNSEYELSYCNIGNYKYE